MKAKVLEASAVMIAVAAKLLADVAVALSERADVAKPKRRNGGQPPRTWWPQPRGQA